MADPDNDNDTASQSSSQTSYCWSNNREMQVVISSYLKFPNDPWTDRKVKSEEVQLSRDVLTHMAGGQNHVVPMLKSILNENEHIALTAIKQEETVKEESQTWEGSPSLLEQEAPPGSGGPLCNSDNETLIGDDFYDNEEIQEVEEIPQKSSRQIRVKKNSDISYKSQYRRPTRVARSKSVLESCSSSQETTGSQFLGSQDSDYENDGQESELEISLQPGAAGSDDPQHELNNETIQSDDSRNTCLLDEEEIPDLLDDPPQKDNDIELKLMQTKNLHVENDDEIPDFEETASNDNSENCSPLALIRTSTPLLNTLLRQRKRSTSRSNTPLLRKRSRGLSKPTIEDPIEENIEDEIEVLEQEVEPSSMSVNVDEDEENEIPEEDDDVRKVKHSRTKSPKPGKQSLLEVMREMIGADIDITDDEVFERFQFKSTLYKKEGFVQHYCPCKMENDIIQHIFRLEPEFPTGTEYRKDVDICPKCFLQYARAGKSEDRTNFLNMVYQFHYQGVPSTFIRMEGNAKRLFELNATKSWIKAIKQNKALETSQFLKKTKLKVDSNGKVLLNLLPAAKSGASLRKAISNPKEKFKLYIKVEIVTSEALFKLRHVVAMGKVSDAKALQTSMHDFFTFSSKKE